MVWMPILGWVMGLLLILAFFPIVLASSVFALIIKKITRVNKKIVNNFEPIERPKVVR